MQHRLAVMYQCVNHFARFHVPDAYGRVARSADDHLVVVLQTEHGARVAGQRLLAIQIATIPDLDRVVAQPRHDLVVVVLQTVDALRVLRTAVDALEHVLAGPPVALYAFDVLEFESKKLNYRECDDFAKLWLYTLIILGNSDR